MSLRYIGESINCPSIKFLVVCIFWVNIRKLQVKLSVLIVFNLWDKTLWYFFHYFFVWASY